MIFFDAHKIVHDYGGAFTGYCDVSFARGISLSL